MISPLSKVFAAVRLNAGVTTRSETFAFHSTSAVVRATKIIIRLRAHATIIVRHRESAKVSRHAHPSG